jgi:predicted RNA binding protein YcfA (HicA-like mRNA interferase family)
MKRIDLIRYLQDHGCVLLQEGGKHSVFVNREKGKSSTVPRHLPPYALRALRTEPGRLLSTVHK